MSAICGIFNLDGEPVDPRDLRAICESSAVRGPDGTGVHLDRECGLAHLAFHVTPESVHEAQPLSSADGRLVLVADARLDNRDELIGKIGGKAAFPSARVTEPDILLRAYQRWGTGCVEHLLGDFVFAVWDRKARTLFLARDPLGGHSLSYHKSGNRFVFASETAAILDLPWLAPEVNEETVTRTLVGLPLDTEDTFFRDVTYLPPAHCLCADEKGMRKWRYWDVDPDQRINYRSDDEYTDHFLELLNQAVAARLRCIGPVGISLSGGNDSTLLAACAARLLPGINPSHPQLKSFSYVFEEHPPCDERAYIEPVVERYGLDATWIDGDRLWTFANLEQQPIARDFLWTNCYVHLPISVAAAAQGEGCRLLLDGHYGDTLCSGPSFFAADLLHAGRFAELASIVRDIPAAERWHTLVDQGLRALIPDRLKRLYRRLRPRTLDPAFAPLAASRLRSMQPVTHRASAGPAGCAHLGPGRRPRRRSLFNASWPIGMAAVRGALYGRYGIEKISPYFDRRLVEFILAIPPAQIALPGKPRRLQRSGMARLLPKIVYERRDKTSYEPLLRKGLMEKERTRVQALVKRPLSCVEGWVDAGWLQTAAKSSAPDDETLYTLSLCLHLELWLRAIRATKPGEANWSTPCYYNPLGNQVTEPTNR